MNPKIANQKTDAATMLEAGAQLAKEVQVLDVNGRPFAAIPEGIALTDLTHTLPRPLMSKQATTLHTPEAFVDYVTLFAAPERTVVFADRPETKFEAVLDFHEADAKSWKGHRAFLPLTATDAWDEWNNKDKAVMVQTEFAAFIEAHIPEIADPDGGDLLEMISSFQATENVAFKSVRRSAENGSVEAAYTKEVRGVETMGKIKIPSEFVLMLSPFEGGNPRRLAAKFRWRLTGEKLTMWYELIRPTDVLNAAFDEVAEGIKVALLGVIRALVAGVDGSR